MVAPVIMAARASSSSSQEILSDGNDSNNCNLYDSDVAEMSESSLDVVPIDLSHAEFGEMFGLNLTEKRAKARRIDLETQTGNCFNLLFIRIYMIVSPLKDRNWVF